MVNSLKEILLVSILLQIIFGWGGKSHIVTGSSKTYLSLKKAYPPTDIKRVRNNYSSNFLGDFTNVNYKRTLGSVFNIHVKDRDVVKAENSNYLPIV